MIIYLAFIAAIAIPFLLNRMIKNILAEKSNAWECGGLAVCGIVIIYVLMFSVL